MKAIVRKDMYGYDPIKLSDKCWVLFGLRIARIEYNMRGNLEMEKRVLVFGIPVYHSKVFRKEERPESFSRHLESAH